MNLKQEFADINGEIALPDIRDIFMSDLFEDHSYLPDLPDTGDDAMWGETTPHEVNVTVVEDVDYSDQLEPIASDLWIGVVLILMILSCVGCVCSCLLYHKFQQWKQHERRRETDPECPRRSSSESLPSYTLVTGLPTYDQAMEAARKKPDLSQLSPTNLVLLYPQPPPPFTETKS